MPNSHGPGSIGWGKGAGAASEKDGRAAGGGNTDGSPPGVGDNETDEADGTDETDGDGGRALGGCESPHPTNSAALSPMTVPRNATHSLTPPISHPLGSMGRNSL